MLIEFLYHFFTLDWVWIVRVISEQLLWVFLFACVAVIYRPAATQFWGFLASVFFVWAFLDVGAYLGWRVGPEFSLLYFILVVMFAHAFLEKNGKLSKYNLPFQIFGVFALWIFFTFFT